MKLRSFRKFLVLVIVAALAYALGWSNLISVREIKVNSDNATIVSQLESRLNQAPAIVRLGQPLARVDKREIVTRLKTFLWVKEVSVRRNILSRVVTITVVPRTPLALVEDPSNTLKTNTLKNYLAADLSLFSISDSASIAESGPAGTQLPILTIATPDRATLADVKFLIEKLDEKSLQPVTIKATDRARLTSNLLISGRKVDVSWGSVKDLPLKIEIVNRLIGLPENSKIKSIDVTEPTAPIVR